MSEQVRPGYYGGPDNVYETIKVIRAWGLNFELGNVAKYLSRAGKKQGADAVDDLRKLITYAQMEIERQELGAASGLQADRMRSDVSKILARLTAREHEAARILSFVSTAHASAWAAEAEAWLAGCAPEVTHG